MTSPTDDPVIDVHAHFLPEGAIRAHQQGSTWQGTRVERSERGMPVLWTGDYRVGLGAVEYWDPPERRLDVLDAAGVDLQVVSVAPPLYRYYLPVEQAAAAAREVNDELRSWVERWPHRFRALATLPLQDTDAAVRELERAATELGLSGVAVGTHVEGENWDSPRLLPVLQAAADLGVFVFAHPARSRVQDATPRYHMRNFIGNPFETTVMIGSLIYGGVLDAVPDLRLVFAHGGGFACANVGRFDHGYRVRPEAQEHASALPSDYLRRVWVDSLTHSHAALRYVLDTVGSDRVVLGTDHPADMGNARPRRWILDAPGLSDAERAAILSGNAQQLLGDVRIAAGAGRVDR